MRCRYWGIPIGAGCRFHGRTRFRRHPGSRMLIGVRCAFLSSPHANLIGINRPCMISTLAPKAELVIGNDCGFSGTVVAAFQSIVLGERVICGANTLITDSNWHPEDPRAGSPSPVRIEDNVWLGVNVTVLKGVTIGRDSVIGAGSVVTRDIPPGVVAAGNPGRPIRALPGSTLNAGAP